MLDVSIWGAFIGGLIVFFSPCVLPIVPFYISYMAGAGLAGLKEDGVIPSDIRRKALISSLFFSLGIITVFVLLGAAAFSISQAFRSFQNEFRWVAGVVIFLMGFHFLGILRIGFLDRQFQVNAGDTSKMDAVGSYRRKALISSLFFSLGIITVFVLLGAAAFSISQVFRSFQTEFRWVAGAVIFLMGFHFLGILRIGFLDRQFQVNAGDTSKMDAFGSYLVGLAFAAGWTPCVGGVLTAVIMTASLESTAFEGIFLLFVFGVGLTLPFVFAALFIKPFLKFAANFRPYLGYVEKLMGLILIFFSILLVTGSISRIANWMLLVFPELFGV